MQERWIFELWLSVIATQELLQENQAIAERYGEIRERLKTEPPALQFADHIGSLRAKVAELRNSR